MRKMKKQSEKKRRTENGQKRDKGKTLNEWKPRKKSERSKKEGATNPPLKQKKEWEKKDGENQKWRTERELGRPTGSCHRCRPACPPRWSGWRRTGCSWPPPDPPRCWSPGCPKCCDAGWCPYSSAGACDDPVTRGRRLTPPGLRERQWFPNTLSPF